MKIGRCVDQALDDFSLDFRRGVLFVGELGVDRYSPVIESVGEFAVARTIESSETFDPSVQTPQMTPRIPELLVGLKIEAAHGAVLQAPSSAPTTSRPYVSRLTMKRS